MTTSKIITLQSWGREKPRWRHRVDTQRQPTTSNLNLELENMGGMALKHQMAGWGEALASGKEREGTLNLRNCEGTENCVHEKALAYWGRGEGGQLMLGWLSCSRGKQNQPIPLIDGPRQGEARLSGSGQRSLRGVWSQRPLLRDLGRSRRENKVCLHQPETWSHLWLSMEALPEAGFL